MPENRIGHKCVWYGTLHRIQTCDLCQERKVRYNVAGGTYGWAAPEQFASRRTSKGGGSASTSLASMLHFPSLAFAFIVVISCTLGTTPFRDFLLYFIKHFLRGQRHAIFARVEHVGIGKHAH